MNKLQPPHWNGRGDGKTIRRPMMADEKVKITKKDREAATKLLQSPAFFSEMLRAVRTLGLVGEEQNAAAVYLVATSRLRRRPLNLLVKGASSAGKNFLVDTTLKLFPGKCVHMLTSSANRAWNYLGDSLQNGIVYVKENNATSGTILPSRLLISEGSLIHLVTERRGGRFVSVPYVTKGPIACITTTTKSRLEVDDETRNVSIRIDESPEQTGRIVVAESSSDEEDEEGLPHEESEAWHAVQELVRERASWRITLAEWVKTIVAPQVPRHDVSIRRHYLTFVHACKIVCLLRSFQRRNQAQLNEAKKLSVSLADYGVTWFIFNSILAHNLDRAEDSDVETLQQIENICAENGGKPVQARDLAQAMNISDDRAYDRIRGAQERGLVRRANAPERTNRKFYVPSGLTRFAPDPASVFKELEKPDEVKFIHPLTGQAVVYRRGAEEKQNSEEQE
jgi:hypothetical protein